MLLLVIHQKARETLSPERDSKCRYLFRIDQFWQVLESIYSNNW